MANKTDWEREFYRVMEDHAVRVLSYDSCVLSSDQVPSPACLLGRQLLVVPV